MSQRRVLLVEDNDLTRLVLRDVLERGGYDVVEAGAVDAAIDRLYDDTPPDVVLVDMHIPGGSGYDVLDAVDMLPPPRIPVVLITGDELERNGFDAVLRKPASGEEILRALREVLS